MKASEIHWYQAVEHRLEQVTEIDGVKFINDSKATNVNATYYALEAWNNPRFGL